MTTVGMMLSPQTLTSVMLARLTVMVTQTVRTILVASPAPVIAALRATGWSVQVRL